MTEEGRKKLMDTCDKVLMIDGTLMSDPKFYLTNGVSVSDPKFYQEVERVLYDIIDLENEIKKKNDLLKEQQERIKVLEDEVKAKNKPMKVVYDMNPMTRLPVSFCPSCGYAVDRYAYGRNDLPQVFCPYCGQALDWKDGEQ